jgi:hypothetical protein
LIAGRIDVEIENGENVNFTNMKFSKRFSWKSENSVLSVLRVPSHEEGRKAGQQDGSM